MINKIGAFIAHLAACGVAIAGCCFNEVDFIKTIALAIFAETMAIYFNTAK